MTFIKLNELKGAINEPNIGNGSDEDNADGFMIKDSNGLLDIEKQIESLPFEVVVSTDDNGKLLFQKSGDKSSVNINVELQKDPNLLLDKIVTHNHPSTLSNEFNMGRSFSPSDISMAILNGVKEIRAVSGKRLFRARLNSIEDLGKPKSIDRQSKWVRIAALYRMHDLDVKKEYSSLIKKNQMTISKANTDHHHEVWARVSSDFPELEYLVEDRDYP